MECVNWLERLQLFEITGSGSTWEIILRLLGAMLIGAIIGTEREYTRRPAGMRTHMLVALGACVVMVTGEMIFAHYKPLGATPDPARLAAQVITGVGFLGAGTILREGHSIKGLTTAASLWSVACLGIAVGAGYFMIAFVGTVCIMLTLTLFEGIQNRLMRKRDVLYSCCATGSDPVKMWENICAYAQEAGGITESLEMTRHISGKVVLTFKVRLKGQNAEEKIQRFIAQISDEELVESVHSETVRI